METISKDQIFNHIHGLIKEKSYVGLHGIADNSDIKNEYSHLSKQEKAENIMQTGLINARGETISHTLKIFGDLSNHKLDVYDGINNYSFNSPSGEEMIAVVAIPFFFEDSKGRKIYGGKRDYTIYETRAKDDKPQCITDYEFRDKIPSEMVLGYYFYNNNSNEVTFVENPKYYTNLSQGEKDDFINATFREDRCLDVNNPELMQEMKEFAELQSSMGSDYLQKTIDDYGFEYDWVNWMKSRPQKEDYWTRTQRTHREWEEKCMEDWGFIPNRIDDIMDINHKDVGDFGYDENNLLKDHPLLDIANRLPNQKGYDPNNLKKDHPLVDLNNFLPYEQRYNPNKLKKDLVVIEQEKEIEKENQISKSVIDSVIQKKDIKSDVTPKNNDNSEMHLTVGNWLGRDDVKNAQVDYAKPIGTLSSGKTLYETDAPKLNMNVSITPEVKEKLERERQARVDEIRRLMDVGHTLEEINEILQTQKESSKTEEIINPIEEIKIQPTLQNLVQPETTNIKNEPTMSNLDEMYEKTVKKEIKKLKQQINELNNRYKKTSGTTARDIEEQILQKEQMIRENEKQLSKNAKSQKKDTVSPISHLEKLHTSEMTDSQLQEEKDRLIGLLNEEDKKELVNDDGTIELLGRIPKGRRQLAVREVEYLREWLKFQKESEINKILASQEKRSENVTVDFETKKGKVKGS